MLKLDMRTVNSLPNIVAAIRELNKLIDHYAEQVKTGCAYMTARYVGHASVEFQLDRDVIIEALEAQKKRYVDYIASLGIELTEDK